MRWGLLVLLCACNQVLDLRPTTTGGVGTDAPFECRADQPPRFSTTLRQVGSLDCQEYNEGAAADVATANCRINGAQLIAVRTGDGVFSTAMGIDYPITIGEAHVFNPRLNPDATRLYTRVDLSGDFVVPETYFDEYRGRGTTWTHVGRLAFANQLSDWISNLSRDPDGRERLVLLRANALAEWIYDGGTWTPSHSYAEGAITPPLVRSVMISPDGLHITVVAEPQEVLWGKRGSVAEPFGRLTAIPDLPVPADSTIFMTSNCGRAYFSGLETLFYAQQQ